MLSSLTSLGGIELLAEGRFKLNNAAEGCRSVNMTRAMGDNDMKLSTPDAVFFLHSFLHLGASMSVFQKFLLKKLGAPTLKRVS